MNKPITLIREELIRDMETLVNSAITDGLPVFAIAPILRDLYEQMPSLERQQYEQDLVIYNKATLSELAAALPPDEDTENQGDSKEDVDFDGEDAVLDE